MDGAAGLMTHSTIQHNTAQLKKSTSGGVAWLVEIALADWPLTAI